ncbi:MAG: STAS domain-containing protein [Pseudomonadota bacterium]|jgi:Anti-anti-sigma regulatory factor (antagonist of anti-sigma factor)|nr:MAG: hypothetical protein DIU56_06125 [Pseudomonadota bacterium]
MSPRARRNVPGLGVEVLETSPGRFEVRGALTFATARRAREAGLRAFEASGAQRLSIGCGGVTAADSAGLAVLLDWLAFARRKGREMRFTEIPSEIRAVARISEVEPLLEGTAAAPRDGASGS